jgi:S1-C subfamily serine protease
MERRVAGAMTRVRDSVVALEYTAADSTKGARRVATGVVISDQGDVLSIRIDRPPMVARGIVPHDPDPSTGIVPRGSRTRQGRGSASPIVARDASGRRYAAAWLAADPETGLTLLRITPGRVRPIRIATESPKLGSSVFVVGNPYGLGHSVSRGHVAGLDRALAIGSRQLGGLTQIQVPLYPGDSGATVANLRGEWLGLIRGGLAASTLAPGLGATATGRGHDDTDRDAEPDHDHDIGFAIPARDAIWIAEQLRSAGRVDRAYLGVRLEPAAPSTPNAGTEREGALLSEILADSPAAAAGLRPGDRIVSLNTDPIRSASDLTDRLDRIRAQTPITLGILRQAVTFPGGNAQKPQEPAPSTTRGDGLVRIEISLRPASRPPEFFADNGSGPAGTGPSVTTPNPSEISGTGPAETASTALAVDATPIVRTTAATAPPPTPVHIVVTKTSANDPKTVPLRPATVESADASPVSVSDPSSLPTDPAPPPAQRPLPLESRAAPPRSAELEPISPRAVIERLERIERRLERIERREARAPNLPDQIPSTATDISPD